MLILSDFQYPHAIDHFYPWARLKYAWNPVKRSDGSALYSYPCMVIRSPFEETELFVIYVTRFVVQSLKVPVWEQDTELDVPETRPNMTFLMFVISHTLLEDGSGLSILSMFLTARSPNIFPLFDIPLFIYPGVRLTHFGHRSILRAHSEVTVLSLTLHCCIPR